MFSLFQISCGPSKQEKTHKLLMSAKEKTYNNDFDGALDDLAKCEKIDNSIAEIYLLRGNLLVTKVKYKEAMIEYNKAIELKNDYAEAYVSRGTLWFYMGDNNKRCEDYLKAESLGVTNLKEETKFCR